MDQTTKYNSSAWRRNRFWPVLLLVYSVGFAQSADSQANHMLTARYPVAMLKSHQANSLQKLGDFYHYLNLLSGTSDSNLQAQIKENIYSLFEDKNTLVDDLTTDRKDRIPLSYLLENIASKQITFDFKNQQVSREFYRDYWLDSYTLEITSGGKSVTREFTQIVYLKPEQKAFGNTTKNVLQVSLGPIE
jgi:hypothetical protein